MSQICKRCTIVAALLVAFGSLIAPAVAQDDLLGDGPGDDLAGDILGDLGSTWWNVAWSIRRTLDLSGPGVAGSDAKLVYFQQPDPLLLYNTGRCQRDCADLRVVSAEGEVLPSGVVNFGRDDGSCFLWCRLPKSERPRRGTVSVYLYYGNPKAKPEPHELAIAERKLPKTLDVEAQPHEEELRKGAKVAFAKPASFFDETVAFEMEDLLPPDDPTKPAAASAQLASAQRVASPAASGRAQLVRFDANAKPASLAGSLEVPAAGDWKLHVRYQARNEKKPFNPFTLRIGGLPFQCGETAGDAPFAWQSFAAKLPAGKLAIAIEIPKTASVDCLILSRDPNYLPDVRDINGPVWMRFNVASPVKQPFHIDMFSMHTTYSINGMLGNSTSYLFGDMAVIPRVQKPGAGRPALVKELIDDPKRLLKSGQWSPWGVAAESGSFTWYSRATFFAPSDMRPLRELDVEVEFATRPDVSRIFRKGRENTGQSNTVHIRMPSDTRLAKVREMTLGFSAWSAERLKLAQSLGFKAHEGPKRIQTTTMVHAFSTDDARNVLSICDAIGLNGVNVNFLGTVDKVSDDLFEEAGLIGHQDHAWASFAPFERIEPGSTGWQAAYEADLAKRADEFYRAAAEASKKWSPWQYEHTNYNVFGDEIGPIILASQINESPTARGLFIEYLQRQGLEPAFFGAKSWDEVKATDFAPPPESKTERGQRVNRELDAELAAGKTPEAGEAAKRDAEAILTDDETEAITEGRQGQNLLEPQQAAQKASLFAKRNYYYTQKFRSYITAVYYRHASQAMRKHYPEGMISSVNLQSMPVMIGRMWDGALNIFDLGRMGSFDSLQVEDWWCDHTNVHFGMALLKAAGRRDNLNQVALLVGDRPGPRMMTNLMQGTRSFHFYLYGPIYNIGPVWAEDQETLRQIGGMTRQIARCEDDLLAAKNRTCEAAVLVANTSEINAPFYAYPFDKERLTAFGALVDSQIPVEVVGEEEILEDDALARYRVLYVGDPHVDRRVQEKIKDWVEAGGTLWSSYAGLARTEFDEPSTVFDEVFGLASRGELKPFPGAGYGAPVLPKGPGVKIPKSEWFEADTIAGAYQGGKPDEFNGLLLYADYKLSTGKALAAFDDGRPAIVHNQFGKGEAILCGFPACLSYGLFQPGRFAHYLYSPNTTARRAQLWTAVADRAKVTPHATFANRFRVQTAVHDGGATTIVFIQNGDSEPLVDEPLTIHGFNRPIHSARSSTGEKVEFKQQGMKSATVPVSLKPGEGKIVVFELAAL